MGDSLGEPDKLDDYAAATKEFVEEKTFFS